MAVKVLDASALGALVFGEPEAEAVAETLSDSTLVAPYLLWFEVASIAFKKIARHPVYSKQIREAFRMAEQLEIELLEVDHVEVMELAAKTRLTTYDASYLWLARATADELVTLDKRLLRAFSQFKAGL